MANLTVDLNDANDVKYGLDILKTRFNFLTDGSGVFKNEEVAKEDVVPDPVETDEEDVVGLDDLMAGGGDEEETEDVINLDDLMVEEEKEEETPSSDLIVDAYKLLAGSKGKDTAKALLGKVLQGYKVAKVSDIPLEHIMKVVDAFKKFANN